MRKYPMTFDEFIKLLGTHQGAVQEEHIQAYLDEYVFRFNRRTAAKRGLLFGHLLENAMQTSPAIYKDLIIYDFEHLPE